MLKAVQGFISVCQGHMSSASTVQTAVAFPLNYTISTIYETPFSYSFTAPPLSTTFATTYQKALQV
jgi:hypothetical protein